MQIDHLREAHWHNKLDQYRRIGEAELESSNYRQSKCDTFKDANTPSLDLCDVNATGLGEAIKGIRIDFVLLLLVIFVVGLHRLDFGVIVTIGR